MDLCIDDATVLSDCIQAGFSDKHGLGIIFPTKEGCKITPKHLKV